MLKKGLKYFALLLLIGATSLFIYGLTSFNFRSSDERIVKKFRRAGHEVLVEYKKVGQRKIRYIKTAQDKNRLAIFVHGGPGSSSEYFKYLKNTKLLKHYQIIAVDRPGYGYSDLGNSETSILKQGRILNDIVKREGHQKEVTVIGHSYGAPIAAAMSMQDTSFIDKLVLVAGAMDPKNEKRFWFSDLTTIPFIYNFVSHSIRVGIDEKESHAESLKALLGKWKLIKIPTIVIHGNKDKMVPVENVDFLKSVMNHDYVEFRVEEDVNHIIQFKHSELIHDALLKDLL